MSGGRRTLATRLTFEGVGIHTGRPSRVTLSPLEEGAGVRFAFGARRYSIREAARELSRRNTTIVFPGGERLATTEHVLAAVVGMGLDDVLIEAEGPEIPILDGSALPFARAIAETSLCRGVEPAAVRALVAPVCLDAGRASIIALPSDALRLTYVIDYPGTALGTEMKDVVLAPAAFLEEIAPARTFALLAEVEALRASGLAQGGALENAIIIGDDGPVNDTGYRIPRECAAHKLLDLLGDLALAGPVARAHYICVCGGHALHAKLVERLRGLFPED